MSKSKVYFLLNVDICIEKDEGHFYAHCPGLKGLHTDGDTIKEAINNARAAVVAYIVSLIKNKEPIPCCRIVREECSGEKEVYNETVQIPELVHA
jgi:predicted RNase H-like HicB family nuclease